MVRETWVQSQVASYQIHLKWYLIPPCLTLSNIMYVSTVKWSKPRKVIAPSPTPRCSSYWKGSLLVALDYGRQLFIIQNFQINIWILYIIWKKSKKNINEKNKKIVMKKHKRYHLSKSVRWSFNIVVVEIEPVTFRWFHFAGRQTQWKRH